MKPLRLITLAGDALREPEIAAAVSQEPSLELVLRCVDRVEALAAIRGGAVELALAIGCPAWFDFQCVAEARSQGIRVMGIAADPVEVEMLEVAGIEVLAPETGLARLARVARAPFAAETTLEQPASGGKVVAVWGAKGAPGRTSIAIELAMTLSASEPSTLLMDADLYGGDLLQLLGVVEELPTIVTFARRAAKGELTRGTPWSESLHRVGRTGPLLLPGLVRAELWEEVSTFGWETLLATARGTFRFSVVDVGFCLEAERSGLGAASRNQVARAAVGEADHVIGVVRADPIGIKSFLWALTDAEELQLQEKLLVVLNRVRPGESRDLRSLLRRHLARPPVAEIPERPDLFSRSTWSGDPVEWLEPGSDVCEQVRDLAAALGGFVPPRGFLSRLAGRGSRV